MTDFIDHSSEVESQILEKRLAAARAQANAPRRQFQPKGRCYYCEEPFPAGDQRLFCDEDCAEDYHKFIKRGAR